MDFDDGDCPISRVFCSLFTKISVKVENVIYFTLGVGYLVKFQLLHSNGHGNDGEGRALNDLHDCK